MIGACVLLSPALLWGCAWPPPGGMALWHIVEAGCDGGRSHGPELKCDPRHRDAVLKDICGPTHFLLIPAARREGVESSELMRDEEPNYFADAWEARSEVIAASGRRDVGTDELGLAINSRWGRSQSQLHIHIDFVAPATRDALRQWSRQGGTAGAIELAGHRYRVGHLASLQSPTPFQRVVPADQLKWRRARLTIAVIGDGASGFYLLTDHADLLGSDRGHAEELLVPRQCGP